MKKGDVWKNGGEMSEYLAMSKFANDNGLIFAPNADGDFELMDKPAQVETPHEDPRDVRIAALEQRLGELEAVLASLISPVNDEQTIEPEEPVIEETPAQENG